MARTASPITRNRNSRPGISSSTRIVPSAARAVSTAFRYSASDTGAGSMETPIPKLVVLGFTTVPRDRHRGKSAPAASRLA